MAIMYSLSMHTLIAVEKIELVTDTKDGYLYRITFPDGEYILEERPETWEEILYEFNRLDLLRGYEDDDE